jgi:cytochrome bd ubiquinol oxidase subunit II
LPLNLSPRLEAEKVSSPSIPTTLKRFALQHSGGPHWTEKVAPGLTETDIYLTLETPDPELQADFRLRALVAAVVLGGVAWAVYFLARSEAPQIFQGLSDSPWGRPVRYGTGAYAVVTLAALSLRWFRLARVTAMVQVALILWGCALAQYPLLVPPNIAIGNSAAPPVVQTLLLIALGAGSVILLPSIYYLFRVFKGHTFQLSRVSTDDPR